MIFKLVYTFSKMFKSFQLYSKYPQEQNALPKNHNFAIPSTPMNGIVIKVITKTKCNSKKLEGENMVKGARAQSKSSFPRIAHDMCYFCVGL